MARYWTCGYGANHDFGEKCDCAEVTEQGNKKMKPPIEEDQGTGQYTIHWPPKKEKEWIGRR